MVIHVEDRAFHHSLTSPRLPEWRRQGAGGMSIAEALRSCATWWCAAFLVFPGDDERDPIQQDVYNTWLQLGPHFHHAWFTTERSSLNFLLLTRAAERGALARRLLCTWTHALRVQGAFDDPVHYNRADWGVEPPLDPDPVAAEHAHALATHSLPDHNWCARVTAFISVGRCGDGERDIELLPGEEIPGIPGQRSQWAHCWSHQWRYTGPNASLVHGSLIEAWRTCFSNRHAPSLCVDRRSSLDGCARGGGVSIWDALAGIIEHASWDRFEPWLSARCALGGSAPQVARQCLVVDGSAATGKSFALAAVGRAVLGWSRDLHIVHLTADDPTPTLGPRRPDCVLIDDCDLWSTGTLTHALLWCSQARLVVLTGDAMRRPDSPMGCLWRGWYLLPMVPGWRLRTLRAAPEPPPVDIVPNVGSATQLVRAHAARGPGCIPILVHNSPAFAWAVNREYGALHGAPSRSVVMRLDNGYARSGDRVLNRRTQQWCTVKSAAKGEIVLCNDRGQCTSLAIPDARAALWVYPALPGTDPALATRCDALSVYAHPKTPWDHAVARAQARGCPVTVFCQYKALAAPLLKPPPPQIPAEYAVWMAQQASPPDPRPQSP